MRQSLGNEIMLFALFEIHHVECAMSVPPFAHPAHPAGAAAARLLATQGHSVVVLTRTPARPALAESVGERGTPVIEG